eukprot:CAMPEP_0180789744 /NCGR_PEP_ID=MMETSP1038_2-20121128/52823_1 /TAXON_ID=632150 /ORGANISM="Azadinium spinosum, Strain 3D9" /LENGTH=100 /DNA_ID=CAMNT_0022827605 /DNA_START=123 /DNA_END=423 /DNA_ORIENTATION=+
MTSPNRCRRAALQGGVGRGSQRHLLAPPGCRHKPVTLHEQVELLSAEGREANPLQCLRAGILRGGRAALAIVDLELRAAAPLPLDLQKRIEIRAPRLLQK